MKSVTVVQSEIKGMTVLNLNNIDFTTQPMFFGAPQGIQRYDKFKYPDFEGLTKKQISFFWTPESKDLQKDRLDYQKLRPEQKHIFTSNLRYQTMLDSVQGRAPGLAFRPYCSLPELESCMLWWEAFENIHSRSYTHIIKNVYPNPSEVFDTIITDENIVQRALSVTEAYDDFIQSAQQYGSSNLWKFNLEGVDSAKSELYELKRKLYRAVMNVNILEGIRFYVSFACSFAFGELKVMEGSAKIIELIARDEGLHLAITQKILKKWKQGDDPDMAKIAEEEEGYCYYLFNKAVEEEKAWGRYLFKDGSLIGLNERILWDYTEWNANIRQKAIGLKPQYPDAPKNNPLTWMEGWLNSNALQEAPMETEKSSYLIGAIKQDVDFNSVANFKL
jgi:ribonucleoside-diphosphate reductase beta chain